MSSLSKDEIVIMGTPTHPQIPAFINSIAVICS
jgi:hypothetical protein